MFSSFFRKKKPTVIVESISETPIISTFFHLIDPVASKAMEKSISIAMNSERYKKHGKMTKVVNTDSYCKVIKRGWKYGHPDDEGPYKGDQWTEKIEEFLKQPDERRCPYCESIWSNKPLKSILTKRASAKFGL